MKVKISLWDYKECMHMENQKGKDPDSNSLNNVQNNNKLNLVESNTSAKPSKTNKILDNILSIISEIQSTQCELKSIISESKIISCFCSIKL